MTGMNSDMFTIGYEGTDIDRFIHTIEAMGIQVLADVRELPLSRKKGFSKSALRDRLTAIGIEYIHFKALGDPKSGREAARSGRYDEFKRIYADHLSGNEAQFALAKLLEVASGARTCMLCFERCAAGCHRSMIASEAKKRGFAIYDLDVGDHGKHLEHGTSLPRYDSGQSLSAAE